MYELLNSTSAWLAQKFRIVLPTEVKIKNSTRSVYSRLGIQSKVCFGIIVGTKMSSENLATVQLASKLEGK